MTDADDRDRGREAYRARRWRSAFEALGRVDGSAGLDAADLELLAMAAYMINRDDAAWHAFERAYHTHLAAGDAVGAARCAGWLGVGLLDAGELAQASGWFARGQRLLGRTERDCVERGYLLIPVALEQLGAGGYQAADQTAARIAEIGERFAEPDLLAFALVCRGRALVWQGRVAQGLAMLDEGMVTLIADELSSPLLAGLLYCNVIDVCQEVYELRRAREWTAALTRWCEAQPELINFTGLCLVHRAEIMQRDGAWRAALDEAARAAERLAHRPHHVGAARYRQAELHRLLGEFTAAEAAYREAGRAGWQPQPGLALLRLAQGHLDAAVAAILRALEETLDPLGRARLLPACVEIMLAAGDAQRAGDGCRELDGIAQEYGHGVLAAFAGHARGAAALAEGDARAALIALRGACQMWQQVHTPYELARSRLLVGLACRAMGDDDSAALELDAARGAFARLGAVPDLAQVDALATSTGIQAPHGLTPRELEVLRLIATGRSNKAIARHLGLSDRTVDRHVSNILTKLGLHSRAAATAYAYEHQLV